MKRTTKIGRLTCDYVSAGNSRICYILAPIPLNGSNIEEWAIRYDYNIVVICGIDWDNDLTPWKAPGVSAGDEDFQGLASDFLRLLQGKVMPEIESSPWHKPSCRTHVDGDFAVGAFCSLGLDE